MKVLLEFDAAMDITYGLIKFMVTSKKFDEAYFRPDILTETSEYYKNLIVSSKDKNPLVYIFKKEYSEQVNDLYTEMMETFYKDILIHSIPTDIFKLVYTWISAKELNVEADINCKNETEAEICRSVINGSKFNIVSNVLDIDSYDILVIDDIQTLVKYKNYASIKKSIYVANKAYNFEDNGMLHRIGMLASPAKIKITDLYIGFGYFKGEIE